MDLRFFFEGMLDREESTSAFLAALLDGSAQFRLAFLRKVLGDSLSPDDKAWHVAADVEVEKNNVDVRMSSPSLEVLVENKIQGAAVRHDQFRGYYESARRTIPPERRIAAIYVAPRNVGLGEVADVRKVLRQGDVAEHVSWEPDISRIVDGLLEGPERWFAVSGLREVLRIIEERRRGLTKTEERLEVVKIADWALDKIEADLSDVPLMRWPNHDKEQIHTRRGLPFMLYVNLEFPESGPPDHDPQTHPVDGRRTVTLRSSFKQGAGVRRGSALSAHWQALGNEFNVPSVGPHYRESNGAWFSRAEPFVGTSEEIADRMASIGKAVIEAVQVIEDKP